jgi:hypothetical protein
VQQSVSEYCAEAIAHRKRTVRENLRHYTVSLSRVQQSEIVAAWKPRSKTSFFINAGHIVHCFILSVLELSVKHLSAIFALPTQTVKFFKVGHAFRGF